MAFRADMTTRVAVRVRGISRITASGVLSSFSSLIRRSSVVLNTACSCWFSKNLPANKKAARSGGLSGRLAAILQIERDPPAASVLS
jgi:hypothetical protein